MKFGGSSNGAPERIVRITELVIREQQEAPIAVVVSAMGDTTDWLLEAYETAVSGDRQGAMELIDKTRKLALDNGLTALKLLGDDMVEDRAKAIVQVIEDTLEPLHPFLHGLSLVGETTPRTRDFVLSFGEQISANVLSQLLKARGVASAFVDSRSWTVTNDNFGEAVVKWEPTLAKINDVRSGWEELISVHTGFLGKTEDGRTTTLGRNGSDYTATLLARGLDAEVVQIWTDVSGVMTADPAIVDDAYPLKNLSYMEAVELASFGTKMFHPRTMIPLIESGIPLRIRSTMHPEDAGTIVDARGSADESRPTSVTSLESVALLDVQVARLTQRPRLGQRVLSALEAAQVRVWMATQSAHGQSLAVAVPVSESELALAAIEDELALERERGDVQEVKVRQPVTLISLVTESMGHSPNVAGRFFHALGSLGINVLAIAQGASQRSISAAIYAEDTEVAVRTVHAAFNFAHQTVSLLILGKGTVGSNLIHQIETQQRELREQHGARLNVVGIADSSRLLMREEGIDLSAWKAQLDQTERVSDPAGPINTHVLEQLQRLPVPIIVDCTAADNMEELYREAFKRGINVVSANKKPLTIPVELRHELMELAKSKHRRWLYETTVGASLPVIETLKDLVRTGDRVISIEGSLSGTLGYLSNAVMRGEKLSEAVKRASESGYTEPNPRDDLSGVDVARKALILTRELGIDIEFSDIVIEPLTTTELSEDASVDEYLAALAAQDDKYEAWLKEATAGGGALRYLAQINPANHNTDKPVCHVGPVIVPADHPSTRLRGTEAFVAFTTERYTVSPLIVQGAGAGGAVTAAGVLADIYRISQQLKGR